MGAGHRGTGDGVGAGGAADPGGEDVLAGSESIDDGAVVGEGSLSISAGGGTNGEGSGLGCGRRVGSVLVLVTGGDGKEETSGDSVGGGGVHGSRLAATERHVGNSAVGAAASLLVVGGEVDTGNDTRVGTGSLGIEDLDSIELGLLSDTVGLAANSASNVGTVAIAIGAGAITCVVGEVGSTYIRLVITPYPAMTGETYGPRNQSGRYRYQCR